jgi:hypothetical protein
MYRNVRIACATSAIALLAACTGLRPDAASPPAGEAAGAAQVPLPADLQSYVDTLAKMAPGDSARQQAALEATLASAQQSNDGRDTLRYALALGSAGYPGSNPVEARRLIVELLASPNDLDPAERAFAAAYLREFDARIALYAELARQRELADQEQRSLDASTDRRLEQLVAENKALRHALAEAERKLEAVAEMERALLEEATQPAAEAAEPPRP